MTSNTALAKRPSVLVACGQGERLLTVEEISEWLGVPVGTIYVWRYRSTGPASYKVGRHVRFRRAHVERWLEDQRTEPIEPSPLRRLLGVATVRNPVRTPNLPRTEPRPTSIPGSARHDGPAPPLVRTAQIPDPTPASCAAGVGYWGRRGRETGEMGDGGECEVVGGR